MEDRDAPLAEGVVEPPFSDLMRRWLDEGDQLSERGVTSPSAAAAGSDTSVGQALSWLRAGFERYRLFVLAGVGLLPLALFTATHQRAAVPGVAAPIVFHVPIATGAAPTPPPVVHEAAVSASKIPVAAPKPRPAARTMAVAAPKSQSAVRTMVVAAPKPQPAVRTMVVAAPKPQPAVRTMVVAAPKSQPAVRTMVVAAPKPQPHRPDPRRHRHQSVARRSRS